MMMTLVIVMPACQSSKKAEDVAQKIEKGETLDQADYSVMFDYVNPAITESVKLLEMGADENDVEALNNQYPLMKTFLPVLLTQTNSFDKDNQKKAQELTDLLQRGFKAAAKHQGVNLDEFDNEMLEDVPGISEEVNEFTPAD